MLAMVFPGQGSQGVGMGKTLFDAFSSVRSLAQEANDILHINLTEIMFNGPTELLSSTQYAQPAIFTASAMVLRAIEEVYGEQFFQSVRCVAGHSVGEYAAILAAGGLTFHQGLLVIKERACAMEAACPQTPADKGGMCAILGLDTETVGDIITDCCGNGTPQCFIANDNCPGQCVVSGPLLAVEEVRRAALDKGAKKGVMLSVSGPFHSALMAPAAEKLNAVLGGVNMRDLRIPLIANYTAQAVQSASTIKEMLPQQVTGTVRWRESVSAILALGVDCLLEVGHGAVLTGIVRRCAPDAPMFSVQTADDIHLLTRNLVPNTKHM
ncbi:MAG: ACP S-malonyltransferase [Holosporales bacterium]|jgi:[acyl-carrier-protein] S-malonyltransferase|nr:ACP S-malonyltransferase [Holosporales bacterium]